MPERESREDALVAQRDALLGTLRRARQAKAAVSEDVEAKTAGGNFAEQQGGVY